ncbi:hypothetical protein BH10CHL1_BH10CHL1_50460 [soil metagenome]
MTNITSQPDAIHVGTQPRWRTLAPVVVLIFLAPVLGELLMGVLTVSKLWLLAPEMGVYGLAALLIREAVRRQRRGWGSILVLGIAYALTEECVILQTSLTPQFFPPAYTGNFGWAFGVHWIYLVAMLWYESVYAIVLPIYLTEILFPAQRDQPWLARRGLIGAAIIFLLASLGVWQLWSHVGLQKYGASPYHVPLAYIGLAILVIVGLVFVTLGRRPTASSGITTTRRTWPSWIVGFLAFGHGLAWFVLIILGYLPATTLPGVSPLLPIGLGLLWIVLGLWFVRYLSVAPGWQDRHRLALIFGASLASMVGGIMVVLAASRIDQIGKLIFDLSAIILFVYLGWRLRQRQRLSKP